MLNECDGEGFLRNGLLSLYEVGWKAVRQPQVQVDDVVLRAKVRQLNHIFGDGLGKPEWQMENMCVYTHTSCTHDPSSSHAHVRHATHVHIR